MPEFDSVIRSRRTVVPAGAVPASVGIRDGRIEAVGTYAAEMSAREVVDLGDTALLPGAIDLGTGVHAPGHELADSYQAVGEAALRGGVTCVVASPRPVGPRSPAPTPSRCTSGPRRGQRPRCSSSAG